MSSHSDYNSPLKPNPSSDGNSTTSHQSQPPATASLHPTPPPTRPKPNPTTLPVRDDCWSEAATFTLIQAWGERILKLNSGSLRQKHWLEVAHAVNNRHAKITPRSDAQCKNRIDTLKKKYKVEKALALELSSHRFVSSWPFFASLDSLIGSSFKTSTKTPTPPPQRKRIAPAPVLVPVGPRSKRRSSDFRRNFSVMAAAAVESGSDGGGNGNGVGELVEAIGRFAEVYKGVEEAKQRQMVELEKRRMEFTKDLELERMKLLMESQMQLRKLKRFKGNSGGDRRSDDSASIS